MPYLIRINTTDDSGILYARVSSPPPFAPVLTNLTLNADNELPDSLMDGSNHTIAIQFEDKDDVESIGMEFVNSGISTRTPSWFTNTWQVSLNSGDIADSDGLIINVTMVGEAPPPPEFNFTIEGDPEKIEAAIIEYSPIDPTNYTVLQNIVLGEVTTLVGDAVGKIRMITIDAKEGYVIASVAHTGGNPDPNISFKSNYSWTDYGMEIRSNEVVEGFTSPMTVVVTMLGGVDTVAPFNRLHVMDEDALIALSNVNMQETVSDGAGGYQILSNRDIYLINLLAIPFKLPPELYPDQTNIVLGDFDTGITTPLLNTDKVTIDLGVIDVGVLDSNSLDYIATTYELYLPYVIDVITLEPSQVINKALSIEYVIDGYFGGVTVNLYTDGDNPIYTGQATIGRAIPIKASYNRVENSLGADAGVNNPVTRAYIKRVRNELAGGLFNNLVSKTGTLDGVSGFAVVDNIELKTRATLLEQSQIISLLQNGVIINE